MALLLPVVRGVQATCPSSTCIAPVMPSQPKKCAIVPTKANCPSPYPPRPTPPKPCSTPQPTVAWPEFGASGGSFLRLDLCNITVGHTVTDYRAAQCAMWEKLCANPRADMRMACAFNRTGPFPSPP